MSTQNQAASGQVTNQTTAGAQVASARSNRVANQADERLDESRLTPEQKERIKVDQERLKERGAPTQPYGSPLNVHSPEVNMPQPALSKEEAAKRESEQKERAQEMASSAQSPQDVDVARETAGRRQPGEPTGEDPHTGNAEKAPNSKTGPNAAQRRFNDPTVQRQPKAPARTNR